MRGGTHDDRDNGGDCKNTRDMAAPATRAKDELVFEPCEDEAGPGEGGPRENPSEEATARITRWLHYYHYLTITRLLPYTTTTSVDCYLIPLPYREHQCPRRAFSRNENTGEAGQEEQGQLILAAQDKNGPADRSDRRGLGGKRRGSLDDSERIVPTGRGPVASCRPLLASCRPLLASCRPLLASRWPLLASRRPLAASRRPLLASVGHGSPRVGHWPPRAGHCSPRVGHW